MEGSGEHQERYPCNYCDKVFFSYQALGGHQNSHRDERVIAVRRMREAHSSLPNARSDAPNNVTVQHAAARMQPNNMLHPEGHNTRASNNGNVSVPYHASYYFRRPYVPARFVPGGSHFHPYARQNHFYRNINPYNNFRYLVQYYPTYRMPMYPVPQTYDFFAAEEHRVAAANSQIINMQYSFGRSNGGAGNNIMKNSIAVSSNAVQNHVDENVANNDVICDTNGVNDHELDLTLHL